MLNLLFYFNIDMNLLIFLQHFQCEKIVRITMHFDIGADVTICQKKNLDFFYILFKFYFKPKFINDINL